MTLYHYIEEFALALQISMRKGMIRRGQQITIELHISSNRNPKRGVFI